MGRSVSTTPIMDILYIFGTVLLAAAVGMVSGVEVGVRAPASLSIEDCLCQCESQVFDGNRCEHSTTVSFNGTSHIKVNSAREDGYELHLWFRTTLANGLLAIGKGNYIEEGNYFSYFILSLQNGKLNLHSNLIDKFEGIVIGDKLNDTQWQEAYILITSSEILLRNKRIQATYPINSVVGEKDTVFENTYLGWIDRSNKVLAGLRPSFIGCMQDVVINNRKITNVDVRNNTGVVEEAVNIVPGCNREGLGLAEDDRKEECLDIRVAIDNLKQELYSCIQPTAEKCQIINAAIKNLKQELKEHQVIQEATCT